MASPSLQRAPEKPAGRVASQIFLVSPRDHFVCPVPSFFRNERNWMKKSARISEILVSPGLPGLQVATRLPAVMEIRRFMWKA